MNKSGELRSLFNAWQKRLSDEASKPRPSGGGVQNPFRLCDIYFYEWSDLSRLPLHFLSVDAFMCYAKHSDLVVQDYQSDLLRSGGKFYMTCVPHCSRVMIRTDYESLKVSFEGSAALSRMYR